ncbi:hypothetical protein [Salinibaculum marinum]
MNKIRERGGSMVYTIPRSIVDELELEAGEEPEVVEWDDDEREVTLSF